MSGSSGPGSIVHYLGHRGPGHLASVACRVNNIEIQHLASLIKTAQDECQPLDCPSSHLPEFDVNNAYEVARLIHEARLNEGAKPVGRKIGFTNANLWAEFGVRQPIWAHVYDTTVQFLEDGIGTCSISELLEPKIEPEIVFCLNKPVSSSNLTEIVDSIEWVAHGFEVVQSHYPGWNFRAADAIVDGGLHGRLLIGPPQSLAELGSDPVGILESFSLSLARNSQPVDSGSGSNVLGNPLAPISHLFSVLAKLPAHAPLLAGEIITTGTITHAHTITIGETWHTELKGIGLPGITVSLTK